MFTRRILAAIAAMIVATLTALTIAGTIADAPSAMRFVAPCMRTHSCPPGTLL